MLEEDEHDFTDQFTADFVNQEPVVFKGLTDSELRYVLIMGAAVGTPLGGVIGFLVGLWEIAILFLFVVPCVSAYFIAGWMERFRRGKPDGYITHAISKKLARKGFATKFIMATKKWSLGRTDNRRR